jgi:prepilin-type N-terminal cleavage/methylation domain-containing protein
MMHRRHHGFTLLEITISLTILGLLSLVVFAGLRVGTRAWTRGAQAVEEQQRFRVLFDRLFTEIKSAYTLRVRVDNRMRLAFIGEPDSLELISTSDLVTSLSTPTGLKRLAIYVAHGGGPDDPHGLVFRESLIDYGEDFFTEEEDQDTPSVEYVVSERVTDIRFRYFYYPTLQVLDWEGEEEGEWTDTWGGLDTEVYFEAEQDLESGEAEDPEQAEWLRYSRLNLPTGIEISLTWEDENGEPVELPPIYVALQDSVGLGLKKQGGR